MRSLIICFSQTGNTTKVAHSIGRGMGQAGQHVEIVDLHEVKVNQLDEFDLIGLGCPVFYYKEPFHIAEFIDRLPNLNHKPWFVFCTHGSVMGVTLLNLAARLRNKNARIIGSHHTYSDGSLPFYPYPAITTGHPDEKDLEDARRFGVAIAECAEKVRAGDSGCIELPGPPTESWAEKEAAALSKETLAKFMPPLTINVETCIKCGECQNACPVEGINVETTPPQIQTSCIFCFYCVKICPTCSIEADWEPLVRTAPQVHSRYIRALNDAEARGDFRWHIDASEIDFSDPWYQQRRRNICSQ